MVEDVNREMKLKLHSLTSYTPQTMAIRFDLTSQAASEEEGRNENQSKKRSYLDLCIIKYGSNGVLEVTPDFTHGKRPYRIEVCV